MLSSKNNSKNNTTVPHSLLLFLILLQIINQSFSATTPQNSTTMSVYKSLTSVRDCLNNKHPLVCLKERALSALNETIFNDKPLVFFDMVSIEKNPDFNKQFNDSEVNELPENFTERSSKLSDILYEKVEDFFKSRTIRFNLAPAFEEGRGKKDKGKGGMMMMGMIGMACMMAQLAMGKIAFLAGSALIIAKVALFLSAIIGIKKLNSGGGGGETQHVVYASSGDYGHGHGGGGGWHRSLDTDDAQTIAYRAHVLDHAGY